MALHNRNHSSIWYILGFMEQRKQQQQQQKQQRHQQQQQQQVTFIIQKLLYIHY